MAARAALGCLRIQSWWRWHMEMVHAAAGVRAASLQLPVVIGAMICRHSIASWLLNSVVHACVLRGLAQCAYPVHAVLQVCVIYATKATAVVCAKQ